MNDEPLDNTVDQDPARELEVPEIVDELEVPDDPGRLERLTAKAKELTDKITNAGIGGLGPLKSAVQVAEEHRTPDGDTDKAIQRLINTHVRLASTTGFLTGLGGLIVLPITLPADLMALWLIQARLAGGIAHLRGYDVQSEEVRSVVLMSLVGSSLTEALAAAGVQISTKSALSALKQVPGKVFIEINKKVGFRLITKFGQKGVVNVAKLTPVVGGVVGGGVNFISTRLVGRWAKKNFPDLAYGS